MRRASEQREEPSVSTDKLFLSLEEAGTLLGIKRGRAWQLARAGYLPTVRLGRRWYVPRGALDRLADEALASARTALELPPGREETSARRNRSW